MSADMELTKLAAKAAGLHIIEEVPVRWGVCLLVDSEDARDSYFDPLGEDGDALWLAVKLRLYVGPHPQGYGECWCGAGPESMTQQPYGDDPHAATRRAIVRAAAAIGSQP